MTKSIVCFGELLWDILPNHKVAGGAPMNVAFHAKNFGLTSHLISAVGQDVLGKELLAFLMLNKIDTNSIYIHTSSPTGTVNVKLNKNGNASYDIKETVAWDSIYINEDVKRIVKQSDILLFGSLACRNENNLNNLIQLIEICKKSVFDVNLRAPFYNPLIIEKLLHKADIVKMNDDELNEIINWYNIQGRIEQNMHSLIKKFNIETLIVTAGKEGAYCLENDLLFHHKGFEVEVKDTVGSGDSFLAAFVFKMLKGASIQKCLQFACATGSLIATKIGGTHKIDKNAVEEFIKNKNNLELIISNRRIEDF